MDTVLTITNYTFKWKEIGVNCKRLVDNVYNNLIRNYYLENNVVNRKKKMPRKHLTLRALLVCLFLQVFIVLTHTG